MKEVVIDVKASAMKNEGQSQSGDTPDTFNNDQAFAGYGNGSCGLGAPREGNHGSPYDDDGGAYKDTFIGIHHSPRGVRVAFQANSKTALIILGVLVILLSHPGVIDLLVSVLKQAIGIH